MDLGYFTSLLRSLALKALKHDKGLCHRGPKRDLYFGQYISCLGLWWQNSTNQLIKNHINLLFHSCVDQKSSTGSLGWNYDISRVPFFLEAPGEDLFSCSLGSWQTSTAVALRSLYPCCLSAESLSHLLKVTWIPWLTVPVLHLQSQQWPVESLSHFIRLLPFFFLSHLPLWAWY